MENDVAGCKRCGLTSRVGRGLCLNCLLLKGLGEETESGETLDRVLDQVDVRDADWRIGNYQILEEIGRGGMGVIYRARQRHSRRIVAVKRILSYHADSRETLARFRREAEAAASLDHPNILPIYEVSESEDGQPFFSMKFAAGGSLLEASRNLRNQPRQIVQLIAKVTRAVQHAHTQGILHRDLKPGNILLDGRGEPLVSDFGLAKWLDIRSDLTRTLTIFGTPGYIAPEQAHGPAKNLAAAADIYSIGAVLFDLFTGQPPFLGEHALSVIKQASEKPAPKLRTLAATADRDLETICARCLEREPGARYKTAGDLAEDLGRWLDGRPILARPVSPPVRIWRWSKRNPKLATSLTAIAVLGAAGLAAMFTSSRLSSIVQNAELARRSVLMMPIEDLDDFSSESNTSREATRTFDQILGNAKEIELRQGLTNKSANVGLPNAEMWKEIGRAANARMVLTGSIRKRAQGHRVAMRLIESATGAVASTWLQDTNSYPDAARATRDKIISALGNSRIPSDSPAASLIVVDGGPDAIGNTKDDDARNLYLQGKEFFFRYNFADQKRAIDSFKKAIEKDANYGQAHAMLASACQARSILEPRAGWLEEAERAVNAAVNLAALFPETARAQATRLRLKGQLRESIDLYLTAYELDPSDPRIAATLGNVHVFLGRPDLALRWFEKAPREAQSRYADNLGEAWTALGDYNNAEKAFKKAAQFRPDLPSATLSLSKLALFRKELKKARDECKAAREKHEGNPQPLIMAALIEFFTRNFSEAEKLYRNVSQADRMGGVDFDGSVRFLSALGFLRSQAGARAEARALLQESLANDEHELASAPDNPNRLYSLAATYAALGNAQEATSKLTQAIAAGWIDHRSIELDPRFDSVRNSQPFKETLTRLTNKVEEMRRQQPGRKLALNLNQ